jgi:hypothetical protein
MAPEVMAPTSSEGLPALGVAFPLSALTTVARKGHSRKDERQYRLVLRHAVESHGGQASA